MTAEEWQELRSMVEDSFWVMRVIGMCFTRHLGDTYPNRAHPFDGRISSITRRSRGRQLRSTQGLRVSDVSSS